MTDQRQNIVLQASSANIPSYKDIQPVQANVLSRFRSRENDTVQQVPPSCFTRLARARASIDLDYRTNHRPVTHFYFKLFIDTMIYGTDI